MTETKKNKLPEPIPVDAKKLIDGLGTIFGGVIQLLNSMEPGMAQQLADMAINGVPKEAAPETINPDEFEEILSADDLPWDTEPEENRANKDKVLALLKSYGAAKVSDIPQDKYEAFLTDVSQL